jgi:Xaa-Pro aminopeptidase
MNYAQRRHDLLRRCGGGVAILTSAPELIRSNDTHHLYRADNDFLYFTGFAEPEAVAVLSDVPDTPAYTLFVRPRDPERETWDGARAGVDGALERFGAERAHPIADLAAVLPGLIERAPQIAYTQGRDHSLAHVIDDVIRHAQKLRPRRGHGPSRIVDATHVSHELRAIKDVDEITRMRAAADLSRAAHVAAMHAAAPGVHEYEVDAVLSYEVRRRGGAGMAYPSIVASGANACTLHYVTNDRRMEDGDLVLIDAGAEFDHYASDVTRTFPVNGRFSPAQREIYELVLDAHRAAIECVRPGARFADAHDAAVRVLVGGLLRMGVLTGGVDEIIAEERYKPFYMHRTGHWLGMDVHDCGAYLVDGASRTLEPGMVITVEPGLYFALALDGALEPYRGIGVRIEDDLLVTASGHENLTAAIPRTVAEIEAILSQRDTARAASARR